MLEILDPMSFLKMLVLAQSAVGVWGQLNIHVVDVGIQGSFYDPPTTAAMMNDVIQFVFGGDLHDVTQSSFETPCVPLPGGFSSGLNGRGSNFSGPTPVWNLEITNVTEPIWFFCGASVPTFHCAEGMVGAINPPSQAMYEAFVAAAKNYSPIATASPSFVASGQGAFATGTPSPISTSISLVPTTSIASSTAEGVPVPTSTPASANSSSPAPNLGPIVGGSVGGGVALMILIIIVLVQRRNNKRKEKREMEFVPYNLRNGYETKGSPPPTGMSERSTSKLTGEMYPQITLGYQGTNNGGVRYDEPYPSVPTVNFTGRERSPTNIPDPRNQAVLTPNRAQIKPATRHPYANYDYNDQDYDGDVPNRQGEHGVGIGTSRSATDITLGVLAKEVAKVLMQSPSGGETKQIEDGDLLDGTKSGGRKPRERRHNYGETRDSSTIDALEAISRDTNSPAPPLYRNYQWEGAKPR